MGRRLLYVLNPRALLTDRTRMRPRFLPTMALLSAVIAMVGLAGLMPVGASSEPTAELVMRRSPGASGWVPGQLIVRFAAGTDAATARSERARVGAGLLRNLGLPGLQLLDIGARSPQLVAQELRKSRAVKYAEPNFRVTAVTTPNDPLFDIQWALKNTGQSVRGVNGTPGADISAPLAWDSSTSSSSAPIAVVDTGLDFTHEDLNTDFWRNPGETGDGRESNGIDDDRDGFIDDWRGWDWVSNDNDPTDPSGHGTHVAGIIGASGSNATGVAGVDWHSSLMALRVLNTNGAGNDADIASAFAFAASHGAKVGNASLAGPDFSLAVQDAVSSSPNTLFVVAAGNGDAQGVGQNNDISPVYPCNLPTPNLICVAATDQNDALASFSNYGATSVDVAAPGVNIVSTLPPTLFSGSKYGFGTGTSMATPFVAGVAGLILGSNSVATPSSVKSAILAGVDPLPALIGKVVSGGRVNAAKALTASASPPTDSRYQPLTPSRILDTRTGIGGVNRKLGPSSVTRIQVAGQGGVPSADVKSVIINVTATEPSEGSHLTIYPTGDSPPNASNLNFTQGLTVANLVSVKLGPDGSVNIFNNSGFTHVLFDVQGYFSSVGGAYTSMPPTRILDTRSGIGGVSGKIGGGAELPLTVAGVAGVPSEATAVIMNVTATEPTEGSHVTIYPTGATRPDSSNLNFQANKTVPNLVMVKIGDQGKVTAFNNSGSTHLIYDVQGYFIGTGSSGTFHPLFPSRVLDTRFGIGGFSSPIGPGQTISVQVAGVGGVPSTSVSAVLVNVTVVGPTGGSHVTVFPDGTAPPNASNLNFIAGQTVPNLVVVKVGNAGHVGVFNNSGSTNLIFDIAGWYAN